MTKLKTISAEAQMRPFNLAQLNHMIATLEQHADRVLMNLLLQVQ